MSDIERNLREMMQKPIVERMLKYGKPYRKYRILRDLYNEYYCARIGIDRIRKAYENAFPRQFKVSIESETGEEIRYVDCIM